ncbi:hypothetical protein HK096_011521 [Nowakowskiella sp. JEL0078]|nr:hypothetical protein HK096_011521 [Nowakowskiella sp. JEL0078]
MDNVLFAPQNITSSPALGWFRKVVFAMNSNSNATTTTSSLCTTQQLPAQNANSVPSCCLQSITPCAHSANHAMKLAALAASGSSFVPPIARVHANVNVTANPLYWDYERASLESMR